MARRRVVTGQTADGPAVVADDQVEPVRPALVPGAAFLQLWGEDQPVGALPTDGSVPEASAWFAPPSGYRFGFITLPPAGATPAAELDQETALAELRRDLPGLAEALMADPSGFHETGTVDLILITEGECWLTFESGARTRLQAGDTCVQNGTRHAWVNETDRPCTMLCVQLAAP